MHTGACKEFYANLTVFIYKKEVARSRVRGVEIEFDSMKLASILNVPGHTVDKQGEELKSRRGRSGGSGSEYRRELMHTAACKEFYANLTVFIYKKKEVARSRARGVEIEFDSMKLSSILNVPGHTGISEYIKEVWDEFKYIMPLEITRKFTNNRLINVARRVQSNEMKPFQRFVHFVVMKNVVPRFGKRDTTSFMDLTYMDHLLTRRKINLPRAMMRHMAYVISVKDHEFPYGDWMTVIFNAFDVPLVNKQGEEPKPKRYDYFEDTFLTMCKLKRENGVWWIGTWENRRKDDEMDAPAEEAEKEEKKEVARSRVRGVKIEFDSMKLASILNVPGHTGISEYIKEVWEESKYIKPLEITRKFANNRMINVARRVQSTEMKPFQRFVHFLVMKNVVPRFGKRETTSFMDLTYMDHLVTRRKINLPRVMMRHMAYVISVKDHELSYGDWMTMIFNAFDVPLVDKQGEEPKRYDYFEDTFLTMCKLKRENVVWWIGTWENRRKDDEMDAPAEEA
ncbi:hypothetical protein Dimus_010334 [Dionaea muscipula]